MQLRLQNSLTRRKDVFTPIREDFVRLYVCGPTVYSYAHIGNARAAVVFDVLSRLLRTLYDKVLYVRNITDIDDKIIAAAQETGRPISEITETYATIYRDDMASLGVKVPDMEPKATDHVPEMIALITRLIETGHAYTAEGHVLFHVPSCKTYGSLSGRSRDDQIAGARVEIAPYKKDPADFVLWKPSEDGIPGWESPWGRGRPGWHIECSAMSEKYLGLPFDIHGGGADLTFPHHENEIAQSCCAHDLLPDGFARYWVHNGFLTVDGEKMSKSLGNVLLVHDLLKDAPGEAVRLTLLSAHYRQPLDWTRDALRQSRRILDRLYRVLHDLDSVPELDLDRRVVPDSVLEALCDDLNTPAAISALVALANEAGQSSDWEDQQRIKSGLLAAGELLGILRQSPDVWFGYGRMSEKSGVSEEDIARLLDERDAARRSKDFSRADEIRDFLSENGIQIEDSPEGTKWRASEGA